MGSIPELSVLKGPCETLDKRPLTRVFNKSVSQYYDKTALIYKDGDEWKTMSYKTLDELSTKISRVLIGKASNIGLETLRNADGDTVIALSMLPSHKMVVTLLAIWKSGAAYLPLEPTFPQNRVKHIIDESNPAFVIYDETGKADDFDGSIPLSYSDLLKDAAFEMNENVKSENCFLQATPNLAIILYTSGSSGVPKGVRLSHTIIQNRLQWQFKEFPYSNTENTCVFKTALTFVDSVCELWGPLITGRALLVLPKCITRDPQRLIQILTEYKIERLVLVPSLLRSILLYLSIQNNEDKKSLLSSLKLWVCSGETLTVSLVKDFLQSLQNDISPKVLCNFYGSTEVMGDVTFYKITNIDQLEDLKNVPIGIPLCNTQIYLLDEQQVPVEMGQVGEVWVAGHNVANGYVRGKAPDRFLLNPFAQSQDYSRMYRTGDHGRIVKGNLIYEGRTDSQIKIRGHRVDLTEVERALCTLPGIEKGVVLCYQPGEMNQALLGFVTLSDPHLNGLFIERKLQDHLPTYMIPQVIILDKIPLLVNGKNDRQGLLKIYENTNNNDDDTINLDIDYNGVPKNLMPVAEILFKTVGLVLGRSTRTTLSMNSNYYMLGGNSLNSILTISKLKESGFDISITDFISAENLGEILKIITTKDKPHGKSDSKYTTEPLQNKHKECSIEMIVSSFYEKADLEMWLKPRIKRNDYRDLLEAAWDSLIEQELSFIVLSDSKPIAVSLSFDLWDEPAVEVHNELETVFEFLEHVEGAVRDKHLPKGKGKIIHSFMMATKSDLTTQQNVAVIKAMEDELMKLANIKNYEGLFTTNTSPLTQQLGTDVLEYETLLDYQVNQFVDSKGNKPFMMAPDSQRAIVCWKQL